MSWIKMRGTLLTNPKVIGVARALLQDAEFLAWSGWGAPGVRVTHHADRDVTRDVTGDGERHGAASQPVTGVTLALLPIVTRVTVGALLPLWSMVNECASPDGVLPGADTFVLDTICGVPGIGRALAKVGWIEIRGRLLHQLRGAQHRRPGAQQLGEDRGRADQGIQGAQAAGA